MGELMDLGSGLMGTGLAGSGAFGGGSLLSMGLCALTLGLYALLNGERSNNNDDDDSSPGGGIMQPVA